MQGGGGNKKRFQHCADSSGQEILHLRALQGHSGRNPIDPSLQYSALIPDNFFEYIYHIGCAINLHSIIISGLVPGGQNLNNRQTDSTLYASESHGQGIKRSVQAWLDQTTSCMGTSRKRGKDTKTRCVGSMYSLLNVKDSNSIKQDVMQSSFTIHSSSLLYLESCCDGIWRSLIRNNICVTSASSNDFLQR